MTLIKFLKDKNVPFSVSEAGTKTIYITVNGQKGPLKIRFSDHSIPQYDNNLRLQNSRKVDLSVDPFSGKTLEDALGLVQSAI